MEQKMNPDNPRLVRLLKKTQMQMETEQETQFQMIRNRPDSLPELEPFEKALKLAQRPSDFMADLVKTGVDTKMIMTLCVQAPMELFHAAGVRPCKLACGSHAACRMAPSHLPALTCPMIRSISGMLELDQIPENLVVPTTCDWVVKFSELNGLFDKTRIHFMELPHLRENETAFKRWLNEIKAFKTWLEKTTQKTITPKMLLNSIRAYARAYDTWTALLDLRRKLKIPALHFPLIANALPYMDIGTWCTRTQAYIDAHKPPGTHGTPVFLTGSPVVFPNYKMLHLIENAGMSVIADDFCTMERTFSGAVTYRETSEPALLEALAQRHHRACICPTFADNTRRINNITGIMERHGINGMIFHVLKGCHPYDIEAGILESQIKEKGFRFIKIETDYVEEDEQNIVTRLEAFRRTLRSVDK